MGNFNFCGKRIASLKKIWATILTILETVKSFWKLVSKDRLGERYRTKNSLDVWKHIYA